MNFLIFTEYMVSKGMDPNFQNLSPKDLADVLRGFYANARKKDGAEYSKSGLVNIRASLNRFLQDPPHSRQINLMKDRDFISANHIITRMVKKLIQEGKDTTKHKDVIDPLDVKKLYDGKYLSNDSPKSLQRKVWFEMSLHFCRRGKEGLHELRKDSFIVGMKNGLEYVTLAYHEHEKNHQGLDPREQEKQQYMFAQPDDPLCPVRSFKLYLSKLHPSNPAFFH